MSREEIVEQICLLKKRIWMLRRMIKAEDEALIAQQQQRCLHSSRKLEDSGPRDNGELTYRCSQCGAFL